MSLKNPKTFTNGSLQCVLALTQCALSQSVEVYLVSDCYIGLDQQHTVQLPHGAENKTHDIGGVHLEVRGSEKEEEDLFEDADDKAFHPNP